MNNQQKIIIQDTFNTLSHELALLDDKLTLFYLEDNCLTETNPNEYYRRIKQNQNILKQINTKHPDYFEKLKKAIISTYSALGLSTVNMYLIKESDTNVWTIQLVRIVKEAKDYTHTKSWANLSGNYVHIFQKTFYNAYQYPEIWGTHIKN